eukprot:6232496-Prymnesium_polylepis.2
MSPILGRRKARAGVGAVRGGRGGGGANAAQVWRVDALARSNETRRRCTCCTSGSIRWYVRWAPRQSERVRKAARRVSRVSSGAKLWRGAFRRR